METRNLHDGLYIYRYTYTLSTFQYTLIWWVGRVPPAHLYQVHAPSPVPGFRDQLDHIRIQHKGIKLPSVHVLGDFKDIDWPDRLNKSGAALSQSDGNILIDIMNYHGLEHPYSRKKQIGFNTHFSPTDFGGILIDWVAGQGNGV